jgi:hypothetical protein
MLVDNDRQESSQEDPRKTDLGRRNLLIIKYLFLYCGDGSGSLDRLTALIASYRHQKLYSQFGRIDSEGA